MLKHAASVTSKMLKEESAASIRLRAEVKIGWQHGLDKSFSLGALLAFIMMMSSKPGISEAYTLQSTRF
jgi:hypothetical protein